MTDIQVSFKTLLLQVGDCLSIQGDSSKTGEDPIYVTWHCKIVGFGFDLTPDGSGVHAIDENYKGDLPITIVWFYDYTDPMEVLSGMKDKDPDQQAIQEALDSNLHLLGSDPCEINLEVVNGVVESVDVSGLCTTFPNKEDVFFRWIYHDSPEGRKIEAEKWCTDYCTRNRFWQMTEIMWFCTRCRVWYHYDCCRATVRARRYEKLEEYMEIPLLKGGCLGIAGTAPLVFSAVRTAKKIQEGEGTTREWRGLLDEDLGRPSDTLLKEMRDNGPGLLDSSMECPKCDLEFE